MSDSPISHISSVSRQGIREIQKEVAAENAMQVESEEDLNQYFELSLFNPMAVAQKSKTLKEIHTKDATKTEKSKEPDSKIFDVEQIDAIAERFQKNNFELNARTLTILRSKLGNDDSAEEVLTKVTDIYEEAVLADEALEFLTEVTEGQLLAATKEAKEKLNKDRGKEIQAGRNMGIAAREFSEEGLGSPSSLRELYLDITRNPREPLKLFDELTDRFRYSKLRVALAFMLHALGKDLKSKGPSIQRGELKRLIDDTRSMQGILGVFRFFQSRMKLIQRSFASYGLSFPTRLNFEIIARVFVKILAERFMNPDKIIQIAKVLGISEEPAAQIVIYTQMRDALKQVAPKYFRDPRHRDELLKIFLDALEKLEELLEEEEEEDD